MKKSKEKRILNDKERTIIDLVHKIGGYVTANKISKETKISYLTVQKYLKKLEKNNILIISSKKSKQKKYSINYEKIL